MTSLNSEITQSKKMPNLIIIGAMKSATTSLHKYLQSHPQIDMSNTKEINFFSSKTNWEKGIEWYKSHFDNNALIKGESSPTYSAYQKFPETSKRMYSVVPDAKLIYIVRDPIKRIISHYIHNYTSGLESEEDINKVLGDFNNDYVMTSKYYYQLEQYLKYYSKSNILIIKTGDLNRFPQKTLHNVYQFLEISTDIKQTIYSQKMNQSIYRRRRTDLGNKIAQLPIINQIPYLPAVLRKPLKKIIYLPFSKPVKKPQLNQHLRDYLIKYLQEDINQLRKYTGRKFDEWCL
ncbi:MAG TPA: sulfotransferase [Cyanothece sp. UBA12306]|nr:sulfotransferase [Cyanothece sp. UBA12306]